MTNDNWNILRVFTAIILIIYCLLLGWGKKTDEIGGIVPMMFFCTAIIVVMTMKFKK